jgi:hypothetical protein
MTREEFNNTRWGSGMKCYAASGGEFDILAVNFPEALIGVVDDKDCFETDEISWYRCESVELI